MHTVIEETHSFHSSALAFACVVLIIRSQLLNTKGSRHMI